MTQQLGGARTLAHSPANNWPQYRKFSASPCFRKIVTRSLISGAVAAALAFSWMPSPDRMMPPPDMHVVTYVQFPRVEIVGKRESTAERTAAVSHGFVERVWIKLAKHGE